MSITEEVSELDIDVDLIRRDLAQLVNIPSIGGSDAETAVQRWCAASPAGHPFGDEVVAAVSAAGAPRPPLVGAPYGSDLRQYAAAGIPTVQYGPGDIAHAHSFDEQVGIDEVVVCARAYAELILARCR